MNKPNFFCDVSTTEYLKNLRYADDHKTVDISVDLIEAPLWFLFSTNSEEWSLRAMDRGEIFSHDENMAVELGIMTITKATGVGFARSSREILKRGFNIFFQAYRNLSYYAQEHNWDAEFGNLAPEAGVLLSVEEGELTYKIVSGRSRPDVMYSTLFGAPTMGRPYADELASNMNLELASFEEQLEAAENGDAHALNLVAMAYLNGDDARNVEPNPAQAAYWFTKLAALDDSNAQFNLGLLYAKGLGVPRDLEKAVYWMQLAADNGDEDAPDLIETFSKAQKAEKAADAGDPQAQAELAEIYMLMGNSVSIASPEKDYALAFEYAQKSAAQDNGAGLWALALCYEHGRGVEEDVEKAIELYYKGAQLGHAPSQHSYACYLMRGDYLDHDDETAFSLFEKSAMQGYKLAEFSLCKMYELGRGTEMDLVKAIEWGEKAATGGSADTQYEVAKLYTYTTDDGEMIDVERARYWYTQAAEQGHEMAAAVLNLPPYNENSEEAEWYQAFEDVLDYENELQSSGLLPDAPSAYDEPGAFYRVHYMAENGDEKAIAVLEAFEALSM